MILLDIFTNLYESIIGIDNSGLDYQNTFKGVGLITIIIAVGVCLLFYLLLGRWKPVWFKLSHWLITLAINSILCFAIAILQASSGVEGFSLGGYVLKFAFLNAILGDILFFITSLLIKRYSKFSKLIPLAKP